MTERRNVDLNEEGKNEGYDMTKKGS